MPLHVFVSHNVFLPGQDDPAPATIEIDSDSGTILAVHPGLLASREDEAYRGRVREEDWHDVGSRWVMAGLVE